MNINHNIIATGTSNLTSYGSVSSFVDNLPNYLKVRTELPSGLAMVSVGSSAPTQEYQNVPWLELDANNNPIALKYFNGSSWTTIAPDFSVKTQSSNVFLQTGSVSFSVGTAPNEQKISPAIKFSETFGTSSLPFITLQMLDCTALDALIANPQVNFHYGIKNITSTGFNIKYGHTFSKIVTDVDIPATGAVEAADLDIKSTNPFGVSTEPLVAEFIYTAIGIKD